MKALGHDAGSVRIRLVRPDDRDRILTAFSALHPQSRYQRFFFPKRELSARELQWVSEPDGVRTVVLVATTRRGGQETVVGVGQYARSGAGAQIAFAVAEDYRGRGIAGRMLRQLADIARECGITQFEADVLADNGAMLKVFRGSKLPVGETEADGIVHVTMSLADGGHTARSVWRRGAAAQAGHEGRPMTPTRDVDAVEERRECLERSPCWSR